MCAVTLVLRGIRARELTDGTHACITNEFVTHTCMIKHSKIHIEFSKNHTSEKDANSLLIIKSPE